MAKAISLAPVIIAIILAAFGQVTMKYAMFGSPLPVTSPVEAARNILSRPMVYVGLVFYAGSSFLWLISLSRLDLSYMYPFTALLIVIITFVSALVFNEPITLWKVVGVFLICAGLLSIARS
ncbi:MAG TPA: EamA family transporter [Candidatus Latescibacteria bacterium]|jgi:multidrug transporter EmrE-like cation transporter|nr:EamA family transporter [Candidatus Latescibacterota bacterium]